MASYSSNLQTKSTSNPGLSLTPQNPSSQIPKLMNLDISGEHFPALPRNKREQHHDIWREEEPFQPFLVVKPKDKENHLSNLSVFKIGRGLRQAGVRKIKGVTKQKDGCLLLNTDNKADSDCLLGKTELFGFAVDVSPHSTLNNSRGVVKHWDLRDSSEEEMLRIDMLSVPDK